MAPEVIAEFVDRYGEDRVVHRTHSGLRVRRETITPALAMNQPITKMMGAKIRNLRIEQGMGLAELALRCGMGNGNPKDRMWRIENATRNEGMRMGTLFAVAFALGVEATELMPTVSEVVAAAKIEQVEMPSVVVRES